MSESINAPVSEAAPAVEPKKAKSKAKKPAAAKKDKKSKPAATYGIERSHDLPWNEKKVAIFKALKSLRATNAGSARPAKDIAEKAGLKDKDGNPDTMTVRHYCYHAKAAGLISVNETEAVRGYTFALTKKGAEIDPVKELKNSTK